MNANEKPGEMTVKEQFRYHLWGFFPSFALFSFQKPLVLSVYMDKADVVLSGREGGTLGSQWVTRPGTCAQGNTQKVLLSWEAEVGNHYPSYLEEQLHITKCEDTI